MARLDHWQHLFAVDLTDPGQPEPADLDDDAADLGIEPVRIAQPHDRLVDAAEHRIGLVQPVDAGLVPPALGDVAPDCRDQRPSGVAQHAQCQHGVLDAAIGAAVACLQALRGSGAHLGDRLADLSLVEIELQIHRLECRERLAGVAQTAPGSVVERDEPERVRIDQHDRVGGLAEHRVDQPLLLGQRACALADQRDVACDAEHTDQRAAVIVQRRLDRLVQSALAACGAEPELAAVRRATGKDRRVALVQRDDGVGIEQIGGEVADDLLLGTSDELRERSIAAADHAIGVLQPDQVGDRVQDVAQLALAAVQLLRRRPLGDGGRGQLH